MRGARRVVGCLVAALVAFSVGAGWGSAIMAAPAGAPGASRLLVAQAHTELLLERLRIPMTGHSMEGLVFRRHGGTGREEITSLWVRVYPSRTLAREAYGKALHYPRVERPERHPPGIGDAVDVSVTGPGTVTLLRDNVVMNMGWRAHRAQAVEIARKVDWLVQNATEIFPRGSRVAVPVVELDVPAQMAADTIVPIAYRTPDGSRLMTRHNRTPHASGEYPYWAHSAGRQQGEIRFTTEGAVEFAVPYHIEVLPQFVEPIEVGGKRPWAARRLHFASRPAEESRRGGQRWMSGYTPTPLPETGLSLS